MQCEMTSRLLIMCTLLALSASTVAVNMSVVPTLSSTMSSMDETVSTSQLSSDDGSGMNSTDGMMMPSSEAISSVVTSSEAIPSTTVSSTTQDIATTASSSAFPTATSSSSSSTARPTAELPSDMSDAVSLGVAVGVGGTVLLCLSAATLILCIYYIKTGKRKKVTPVDSRFLGQSHNDLLAYPMNERSSTGRSNSDDVNGLVLSKTSAANIYAHLKGRNLPAISLQELAGHVAELHENDDLLAEEEYSDIKTLDPVASTRSASLSCNELRNRYINILANEPTRVVLSAVTKGPGSDYINANYIDGYSDKVEYIAAQGPLPNTVVDFWRMIWEKDVRTIVMVTNLVENGVEKSHEYWPSRGTIQYGQVVVTLAGQKLFPEFVKRKFAVSFATHNSQADIVPQTIVQYHFTVWPDFGVPQHASAMLKFIRRVRKAIEPDHGPVVVHCSAGVGRSGTFIAIDMMLQKMDAGDPINIMEFVCKMRAQRNNMVQTSAQYLFIYDALLHSYLYGITNVIEAELSDHIKALSEPLSEETPDATRLDKEFELIMSEEFVVEEESVALMEFNSDKNRSTTNIPFDHNRVVLENMEAPPGHDYINASFINGYYNRHEFIATQHPLSGTVDSYWRMIAERDVFTIVTIGPVDEKDAFWPDDGSKDYGGTTVEVLFTDALEECGIITVREMEVERSETEKSLTVRQFHLSGYPSDDDSLPSPEAMLELVNRSREYWRGAGFTLIAINTSPTVVNEAAGIYCALCILLRQLEVEGSVDLVTTVQRLRRQRPGILTAKENVKFLYEVLQLSLKT